MLCLGLLTRGEATGYELKKAFASTLGHFFDAGYGSIYPALARLTTEQLVTCTALPQDKRPDKKIYRITPRGRLAFLEALAEPPGRDRFRSEFIATMLFADLLHAGELAQLVDAQLANYRAAVAELDKEAQRSKSAGAKVAAGLGAAMLRAGAAYIDDNRHLLESAALLGSEG